jgi:hypothetical protein
MGEAQLILVSLNSKDLERTYHFYSTFSANLRWDSLPSGTKRLLIEVGSVALEFYPGDRYGKEPWVSLEFRVSSVYACMVALGSKGFNPFGTSRYTDDSGYDSMMYTDPDGHIVRLIAFEKETEQVTVREQST